MLTVCWPRQIARGTRRENETFTSVRSPVRFQFPDGSLPIWLVWKRTISETSQQASQDVAGFHWSVIIVFWASRPIWISWYSTQIFGGSSDHFFFQAKRKRNRRRHETFLANRRWRKENLKKNSKKRQGRAEASMDGLAGDKRRWWTEYWTTREQRNNVYIERQKKKHVWSDHHHP